MSPAAVRLDHLEVEVSAAAAGGAAMEREVEQSEGGADSRRIEFLDEQWELGEMSCNNVRKRYTGWRAGLRRCEGLEAMAHELVEVCRITRAGVGCGHIT